MKRVGDNCCGHVLEPDIRIAAHWEKAAMGEVQEGPEENQVTPEK